MNRSANHPTYHRTVEIDGLEIFYREAGDPKTPTVLLLHGFAILPMMLRHGGDELARRPSSIRSTHRPTGAAAL